MAVKNYRGKRPEGVGWVELGVIEGELRWVVFTRTNVGTEWLSVKVAVDGVAPSKANYWLGWNGFRFGQHADVVPLLQHRPEVFGAVEGMLKDLAPVEGLDLL